MFFHSRWLGVARGTRWCFLLFLSAGLLCLGGCSAYSRKPLAAAELIQALDHQSSPDPAGEPGFPKSVSEAGLTRHDAQTVALFYNPGLRAARLRAQVPVLSAREAGRWEDPELGADAMRILADVEKPWIAGASLAFTLPLSGRLSIEKEKATAEGQAARVEAWATEQQLLRELHQAWIEWEAALGSVNASRASLGQLELIVAITERLEKAGELIAVEGVAFRLSRARSRLELDRRQTAEHFARMRILALMGLLPQADLHFVPSAPAAEPKSVPTREDLLAQNPTIILRAAEYEIAEQALRLEVRRQYPDLQIGPAYGNEDGESRIGLGFSIPLPILNRNKRGIVEAYASREAARGAWEEAVQQALVDAEMLRAGLEAAEQRSRILAESIVPLANDQLTEARDLAEKGEINALLLLESLMSQRDVALEQIEAQAQVALARAALSALAPTPPPNVLPSDSTQESAQ